MKTIITKDFNLSYTLESGQFFTWKKDDDFYTVISGKRIIRLKQKDNILWYEGCSEKFLREFFRLDFPLEKIEGFHRFPALYKKLKEFYGMRLIKQDVWECILSFVLSINSSIKIIQKNLEWLAKKYGCSEKDGCYFLPSLEQFQGVDVPTKIFGLRAKFLKKLGQSFIKIKDKLSSQLSYAQKKELLMSIYGVGDKVSECILLYSLNEDTAFPVDRWIARFLTRYFDLKIKSKRKIREWAQQTFGENCGWLQQYIYMFARKYKIL